MRALVLMSLLPVSIAAAQPAPGPASDEYAAGRTAYDLRDWDTAIAHFKAAYKLASDAASLFNIAQSYRLKGDCVEALAFYKTYKRNFPEEGNIAKVDKFITELEPCAAARAAQPKIEPPPPPPTPTEPTNTPVEPPKPATPLIKDVRRPSRLGTYLMIGGAASAAVGIAAHVAMWSARNDLTDAYDRGDREAYDQALPGFRRDRLIAFTGYGVAAALLVTGYLLRPSSGSNDSVQVGAAPLSEGGALVGIQWTR